MMEVLRSNRAQKQTHECLRDPVFPFKRNKKKQNRSKRNRPRPLHCKKLASCHISQLMLNVLYYDIDIFLNNWYSLVPLSYVPKKVHYRPRCLVRPGPSLRRPLPVCPGTPKVRRRHSSTPTSDLSPLLVLTR